MVIRHEQIRHIKGCDELHLPQWTDIKAGKSRPKLLVVSSTYPRWKGDPEPTFVHELARRLRDHFDIVVLCPRAPGALDYEVLDGVQVYRYSYGPRRLETLVNHGGVLANLRRHPWKWMLLPTFLLCQMFALKKLARVWRPNLIHAHWLLPQGSVVALARPGIPLVVTSHGADLFALNGRFFRWLRTFVLKRAAAITVVSEVMFTHVRRECPTAAVHCLPMGVDLENRFRPFPDIKRSKNGILFVGRLVEKKGLVYLIRAMPAIIAAHPGAYLDIAGFGPELERLMREVVNLGVRDSVRFLGPIRQEDLPQLYAKAAVFVAPFIGAMDGDQEGLGLVVAEAIGCLCPVIVGDVPAVRDLVGADSAVIVPQRNSNALAISVMGVLADPSAAEVRAAEMRRKITASFSWASVAGRYQKLLSQVMTGSQNHG